MTRTRIGALVAATAIVLAACGGATPSSAPLERAVTDRRLDRAIAAPSADAARPKAGGTLVVAIPGDINRTDPALIDDASSSYVLQQIIEGLVTLTPGIRSEIVGRLAESWTISERRPDLHVQAPQRHQVPRRHGLQRRRRHVQLRALDEHPADVCRPGLHLLLRHRLRPAKINVGRRRPTRPPSSSS